MAGRRVARVLVLFLTKLRTNNTMILAVVRGAYQFLPQFQKEKPKHYAHKGKLLTERNEQDFSRLYLVSEKILGKMHKFKNFSSWLKRE